MKLFLIRIYIFFNLANLYSQNERARIESADLCKQLALKCSDSTVVSNILNILFNIYHGSEGKLSTSEQKMNILQVNNILQSIIIYYNSVYLFYNVFFQAIGNYSYNSVTNDDNSQKIAELVVDQFIKVLDNELHEKTLVHAIQMLSLWSSNFKKSIPKALLLWFVVSITFFIV